MIKHSLSLSLFPTSEKKEKAHLCLCKGILQYWPCVDFKTQDGVAGRGDPDSTSGLCSSFKG